MNTFLKRIPVRMVLESSNSASAPVQLGCRTAAHLTTRLNKIEQRSYEDAIAALNALQTNTATVQKSLDRVHNAECKNVKEVERFLNKVGITLNDLDKLSVIHVAGTKGKGSTCALVESILRNLNVKTGFYSSPHLLSVAERIRLNGEPLSKVQFSQYFWKIYNILDEQKQNANDMPPYFYFLTIMAYYVFLKEKVDVAVVEVGIGGEFDCTNVVRNTKTVGITSLGLEHTQLLGTTYRDIAWQKSGIIKSGSSVYSTHQNDECIPVLLERAHEKNANLKFIPELSAYKFLNEEAFRKIAANPTKLRNASLAIELSYDWIRRNPDKLKNATVFEYLMNLDGRIVPNEIAHALETCHWPGRCQILNYQNTRLYIDGAHTADSLQLCLDWFKNETDSSSEKKFLLFNVTGDRNANDMLDTISKQVNFEEALFTPNVSSLNAQAKDNVYTVAQPNRSQENAVYWLQLASHNKSHAFNSISDVFKYLQQTYKDEQILILVTGSLHLIGEVLRTIQK